MINVLFMGTPDYAQEILLALIEDNEINVVGVYTQPDKPVGRKKVLTPPAVKVSALEYNLPLYQPQRLRDEDTIAEVLSIKCDFIVVAAYGQILPKEILDHAPCINLHASILPAYRGASPIQQTLLNGDTTTGVTAMLMDVGLDTGDILKIETLDVKADMMVEPLFDELTKIATTLTLDVVKNFSAYTPVVQDDEKSTHCKKITKKDGEVLFDNALNLYNKYRAFTPWPGIYLSSGLKLKEIELIESSNNYKNGTILSIEKDGIVVGCNVGSIKVLRVQAPSKKEVDVLSYINGKRLGFEDTLS